MKSYFFEQKILNFINDNDMLKEVGFVVVGVSGGSDSVCLLHVLNKYKTSLGIEIIPVHINHNIRGEEALRDENFVRDICKKYGLNLKVESVDAVGYAKEHGLSTEEAGRILRYNTFEKYVKLCLEGMTNQGKSKITARVAVAHNSNDNAETVLFNILRGSGISGAAGIKAIRDDIIRPLLCVSKVDIEKYLNAEGVDFVTDSTNLESDYTRNVIRNELLPFIREHVNEGVDQTLLRFADIAKDTEEFIEEAGNTAYGKYYDDTYISSDILNESRIIRTDVYRKVFFEHTGRLKDITREHMLSIDELWNAETGSRISLPYGITAQKCYEGIKLSMDIKPFESDDNNIISEGNDEQLVYEDLSDIVVGGSKYINNNLFISCRLIDDNDEISRIINDGNFEIYDKCKDDLVNYKECEENYEKKCTKYLDYDKINGGIFLRTKRQGDYLVINKEGNTKKLKDIFRDEKIPREERDKKLLICQENRVLWIVGLRGGVDTNIDNNSKRLLEIIIKTK